MDYYILNSLILIFILYLLTSFTSFCFFSIYLNNYQNVEYTGYSYPFIDSNVNYLLGNESNDYLHSIKLLLINNNLETNLNLVNTNILINYLNNIENFNISYETLYIEYLNYFLINYKNNDLLYVLEKFLEITTNTVI